jgi:hexokinase
MLLEALNRAGLQQIRPVAIINDTAATLLSAAYQKSGADIASICGTGHNTCYLENNHPLTQAPMIVNLESGNFAAFPRTLYDEELDRLSEKPSLQLLEKACSSHYLGEILRLIAQKHFPTNTLPYSLKAETIAELLAMPEEALTPQLAAKLNVSASDTAPITFLRQSARLIVKRSARLVAATFAGTLLYLDQDLRRRHLIAIDGSLYEKMPGYAAFIRAALDEFFGAQASQIELELVKDGSGLGAAIAAATVCGNSI